MLSIAGSDVNGRRIESGAQSVFQIDDALKKLRLLQIK